MLQLEQNRTVSRQRNRTQTILAGDGKRLSGAAKLRGIAVKQNRKLRQGSGEFLFAVRKIAQGEQRFSVCTAFHAEYAGRIRMIFRPPEIIRRIICVQRGILHISFTQAVEKSVERTFGQCPVQCTGFAPFVQLTQLVAFYPDA